MAPKRMAGGNRPQPRPSAPRPQRAAAPQRQAAPRPQRAAAPQRQAAPQRAAAPQRQAAPQRAAAPQRQQARTLGAASPLLQTGAPTGGRQGSPQTKAKGKRAKNLASRALQRSGTGAARSAMQTPRGGRQKQRQTQAATPTWMTTPEAKYIRPADMYGMGTAQQGVFSGASWNQMKAEGYTDEQIRDYLISQEGSGLIKGVRVEELMNNWDQYYKSPVPDMPAGFDPSTGQTIKSSLASEPDIFFSPVRLEGVNNMWGNPLGNGIGNSVVVGDGINWKDPAYAEELAKYYTTDTRRATLAGQWAMSTANPDLLKNMAAFLDSGHRVSLITGKTPQAELGGSDQKYPTELFNLSKTNPWTQAYDQQLAYQGNWQAPTSAAGRKQSRLSNAGKFFAKR